MTEQENRENDAGMEPVEEAKEAMREAVERFGETVATPTSPERLDESTPVLDEGQAASEEDTSGEEPPLDLNSATEEELEQLPGIGPVLAARIVQHRTEVGPFQDPAEIMAVTGISDSTYDEMAGRLMVSTPGVDPGHATLESAPSAPEDEEVAAVEEEPSAEFEEIAEDWTAAAEDAKLEEAAPAEPELESETPEELETIRFADELEPEEAPPAEEEPELGEPEEAEPAEVEPEPLEPEEAPPVEDEPEPAEPEEAEPIFAAEVEPEEPPPAEEEPEPIIYAAMPEAEPEEGPPAEPEEPPTPEPEPEPEAPGPPDRLSEEKRRRWPDGEPPLEVVQPRRGAGWGGVLLIALLSLLLGALLSLGVLWGINRTLDFRANTNRAIRAEAARVDNEIATVQADLGGIQGQVQSLQALVPQVSQAQADIRTLRGDLNTVQTQVAQLGQDVSTVQSTLSSLSSQVDELAKNVTDIQSEFSAMQEQLTAMGQELDAIRQQTQRFDAFLVGLQQLLATALPPGTATSGPSPTAMPTSTPTSGTPASLAPAETGTPVVTPTPEAPAPTATPVLPTPTPMTFTPTPVPMITVIPLNSPTPTP